MMTSSNAQAWNTKHILLNNLGSKHSLVMIFGQFMYNKIDFLIKKFHEQCSLETSSWDMFINIRHICISRKLKKGFCNNSYAPKL